MKRSTLFMSIFIIVYVITFGLVTFAVSDKYGAESFATTFIVIIMGPVALIVLVSHKGLDEFLRWLDGDDE